jgi:hypothetical protein
VSAGPIKGERDSWKAIAVSTPNAHRICFANSSASRTYCGRTSAKQRTSSWAKVVCWDCRAAAAADGLEVSEQRG